MSLSQLDIELTFIRSLACSGFILSGPQLSQEDRRERIRAATMKPQVPENPFPLEVSIPYPQASLRANNRPCELRRFDRDQNGRAVLPKVKQSRQTDDFDDFDDEAEDAEMGLL